MPEGEAVGVEAHRGIGGAEGLARAEAGVFQINRIADNRVAEVPKVGADLVGAAGERSGFDERGAVGIAAQQAEFGFCREAVDGIDIAGAGTGRFGGDRGFARKFLRRRVTVDAREVGFFDLAALELGLQIGRAHV